MYDPVRMVWTCPTCRSEVTDLRLEADQGYCSYCFRVALACTDYYEKFWLHQRNNIKRIEDIQLPIEIEVKTVDVIRPHFTTNYTPPRVYTGPIIFPIKSDYSLETIEQPLIETTEFSNVRQTKS